MMRLLALGLTVGLLGLTSSLINAAPTEEQKTNKDKLRELSDFIGGWKGSAATKDQPKAKDPFWNETVNWGWRFKGDDAWLTFDVKGGKQLKGGEVRYLPAKKKYQLTTIDKDGKKADFLGDVKNDVLTVERVDPASKETQRLTLNTAGDGVRLILRYGHKPAGSTLFRKDFMVAATKEGESLGAKEKKNICVVSGGVGTMALVYKGETFYVCCSGCRDAFNENPEKFVKKK